MRSHEFARHLSTLAKALKTGPDIEIDELFFPSFSRSPSSVAKLGSEEIPHALHMLVGLNQVSKQQWLSLIDEFGFEIDVRPRDANRDIFGKLLRFLTDNPEARDRLIGRRGKKPIKESADLADALRLLMK